jgi:small conductance mechanosensitive channel
MPDLHSHIERLKTFAWQYGPRVLAAIVLLIAGFWVANWLTRILRKSMRRKGHNVSLRAFLTSVVSVTLKIIVLITAAGIIGIQTTSFVAILGAASLAVGLALQGSLANFAGGLLIMLFKPFVVGDTIEAQGQLGEVIEIQIFNTILLTLEDKTVILPNGALSNGTLINHSSHGHLRLELKATIAGGSDVSKAREIILKIAESNELVMKDPKPEVVLMNLKGENAELSIYCYTLPKNQWPVRFTMYEEIRKQLAAAEVRLAG